MGAKTRKLSRWRAIRQELGLRAFYIWLTHSAHRIMGIAMNKWTNSLPEVFR